MQKVPYQVDKEKELELRNHVLFGGPWRGPTMIRGEGVYCYDESGKEYLDCESQAWSLGLGFANKEVIDAAFEQAQYLYHMKGGLNTFPRLTLASKVLSLLPPQFDRVSFEPSGSIAVEAAFKIAMINRPKARYFLSLYHGFHGNTLATSAAGWHATKSMGKYGGGAKYLGFMENFIKVPNPYCYRCPFNQVYGSCDFLCAQQLRNTLQLGTPGPVAALILEPVQASGGQIPCPPGYLERVRAIVDEFDTLLIFDEMQTGFGRCGTMFGLDYYGVAPDMLTIGKAFGNGFPIAGMAVRSGLQGFVDGTDDNYTYCNSPMAQAAALKTIEILLRDNIPQNAKKMGEILTRGFKEIQKTYPILGDVRGPGLHIGIEVVKDPVTKEPDAAMSLRIYNKALSNGMILGLGGSSPQVIKVKPPLIITEKHCSDMLEIFERSVREVLAEGNHQ